MKVVKHVPDGCFILSVHRSRHHKIQKRALRRHKRSKAR